MTSQRDVFLFVALAVAWGTAFGAIEVGLTTLPPILFAALRLDGAVLLFAVAIAAFSYEWRPRTRSDWLLIAVSGGLVVGGHYGLLFLGQSYVSSAVASIVLSLTPIMMPVVALAVLPRERLRAPAVAGLAVGLVGVVTVALSGGSLDGRLIGIVLLFGSSLVFVIGSVLTERTRGTLPLLPLQAWAMAVGAATLHALSFAHPGEAVRSTLLTAWTPETAAALAYLAVVSTAGGFLAYFALLERVGASELSLVNYASPVVATIVGWALLGETITLATVAGFGLIVLGFALCKIDALWKLGAPAVGYGPTRPATAAAAEEIVVDGNVYVTGTDRYAGSVRSAD